jgi:hypothetical protein
MTVKNLFSGAKFIGQAEGERRSYYVFQADNGYLVATPQSTRNYSVTVVQSEVPEVISRKYKGKQVTVSTLKSMGSGTGLFRDYFDRLNALYVMVALGRAKKLKKKLGRAMLFRVK